MTHPDYSKEDQKQMMDALNAFKDGKLQPAGRFKIIGVLPKEDSYHAERMKLYRKNMTEEQREHRRAYQRAYYQANREKYLAYDRDYKRVLTEEQKERRRAYDREYRKKKKEQS